MAGLGGFNPAPFKFGEAASTDLEAIQNAFADTQGTSLARERGSVAWVENHATARVLYALYGLAYRLANVNDPARMTNTLPRWEKILNIAPLDSDTIVERRNRVTAKLSLLGKGTTLQVVEDYLTLVLGSMFVGLKFSDPTEATTYVPGGGAVPGGGPAFLDGDLADPRISPYASSLGYIAVLLQRPANMTVELFYERAGRIYEDMNNLLGAWMDFDWVNDGPNGAGFYLDEDRNLDNQRFDAEPVV